MRFKPCLLFLEIYKNFHHYEISLPLPVILFMQPYRLPLLRQIIRVTFQTLPPKAQPAKAASAPAFQAVPFNSLSLQRPFPAAKP